MSDYIKREYAKAKIREEWVKYVPISADLDISLSFILAKLEDIPSADVVERKSRPQGHYIKGENGEWYCSNCKRIDDKYSVAKFCWYCGADMRGSDNE